MARYKKPTPEQEQAWINWLADQPPYVGAVGKRLDPWSLFWLRDQRVTICGFNSDPKTEKVTVQVNVTGQFNLVMFDKTVFGVDPNDLTPADLPAPDEPLGAVLKGEKEIEEYIELVRPAVLAARQRAENEI
jgi:hypothetical protein